MKTVEVCISPEMLPFFDLEGKIVIVVDIFRATSCMITAFANEVKAIIPVETVEECQKLQRDGLLAAAEREGQKVAGFDLDNSPFSYMQPLVKHQTIAMTTTNGTKAIRQAALKKPHQVLIGAFLNITTLKEYLFTAVKSVVILCSGWKNRISFEDTLFAGALVEILQPNFEIKNDTARLALLAYQASAQDLLRAVKDCEHGQRLAGLDLQQDIAFCLRKDVYRNIPILQQEKLKLMPIP